MSESYKKLVKTLQTIFEMDKADLDFGIYRIMNQKRDDINAFLENDLLPQVKDAFAEYGSDSNSGVQSELDALIKTLSEAGMNPDESPKVQELKEQLKGVVDSTAIENEVFSKLHTFFSRYYDKGDFISQRRYKADTYAIPYEGEEVKLYWANHDQYYIKSSEHLRDYAFLANDDEKSVRIKLVEADTEKDNVKAKKDEERKFVLDEECPLSEENGELLIHFNYVPAGKQKQEKLNETAVETILSQDGFDEWLDILKTLAPTESNPKRTLLGRHLNEYTARNTFDYFIHKDLGGFLERELDFFIKNEVLFLDDIEEASFTVTEQQLKKLKIIRSIAKKIIRMLAQLENFQKKLWLKKKFAVEVHYASTLDQVPFDEGLANQIVSNQSQKAAWYEEVGISADEIDVFVQKNGLSQFWSEARYASLIIDTKHFDQNFHYRFLSLFDDLDSRFSGTLIHSDNFQGISLLSNKLINNVDGIYIDPPYNTDASAILYKNGFKDSSWLSLMNDRISAANRLLKSNGIISVAIDDQEVHLLRCLLDSQFEKNVGIAVVKSNPQSRKTRGKFSPVHEYGLFYGKSEESVPATIGYNEAKAARYPNIDSEGRYAWMNFIRAGSNDLRSDRPRLFYPIFVTEDDAIRIPKMLWNEVTEEYDLQEFPSEGEVVVYPIKEIDEERVEKNWQRGHERVSRELGEYRVRRTSTGISIDFKTRMDADAAPVTWWEKGDYASANYGAAELKSLFGFKKFDFPKAKGLVKDSLKAIGASSFDGLFLDFFAGSGTTAQAMLELNRDDNTNSRYIVCEQGPYMDTLIRPRIHKVCFSDSWENGKPNLNDETKSISHGYKYVKLESYEDTLNNLRLVRSEKQQSILESNKEINEDYLLGYWLDVESNESPSLLNIDQFQNPFDYKLKIGSGSVSATEPKAIDLVETFNYLVGLTIKAIDVIRGFVVVTGTNPQGDSVLVVWRDVSENDNEALEAFLDKQGYNPRDTEFDHIYVNGDHTLDDPQHKVKMTEIEFKRLMFDVSDV